MEPRAHSDCFPRIAPTAVLLQDLQPVAECSSGRIGVVCRQTTDVFPIGQPFYLKKIGLGLLGSFVQATMSSRRSLLPTAVAASHP